MNQYNIIVQQLLAYLTKRKQCSSSRLSHKQCYEEFGQYLEENNLYLSQEVADQWIASIQGKYNWQKCYFWRQYISQLIVFQTTGSIPDALFYQIQSSYDKVPDSLKYYLNLYLENCRSRYTDRSFEIAKVHCSRIMYCLSEQGITEIQEIAFSAIDMLIHTDFHCSKDTREMYLLHARFMLEFFASLNIIPAELSVMLDDRIYFQIGRMELFSSEHQTLLEQFRNKSSLFSACEFHERISAFETVLRDLGYGTTQLKSSSHILKALYLFLYRYGLGYHPEIAGIWFEEIRRTLGNSWKNWRRILRLFKQYTEEGIVFKGTRYTYRIDILDTFPEWCRIPVKSFMDRLIREFRSHSTARNYKFSCLRFCRFLITNGINGFDKVTIAHIRLFSLTAEYATPYGRATSFAVIRQFLYYLEEQKLLQTGLHQALFSERARSAGITDILGGDQIQRIHEYRHAASTPMELRTAAIVTVGLELGLRASDVVRLKMKDIDWKNRRVSVIQYKTQNALSLPLTTAAGNAVYRYLVKGRPETASPYVFVHHHAPYDRMSTKICNNSLYCILPERYDVVNKGFHVLRRTFATTLLRNNAGIQMVMDSLGHTDNTSVMKYLSFDEERMRLCPLSLTQYSLLLEGGAV